MGNTASSVPVSDGDEADRGQGYDDMEAPQQITMMRKRAAPVHKEPAVDLSYTVITGAVEYYLWLDPRSISSSLRISSYLFPPVSPKLALHITRNSLRLCLRGDRIVEGDQGDAHVEQPYLVVETRRAALAQNELRVKLEAPDVPSMPSNRAQMIRHRAVSIRRSVQHTGDGDIYHSWATRTNRPSHEPPILHDWRDRGTAAAWVDCDAMQQEIIEKCRSHKQTEKCSQCPEVGPCQSCERWRDSTREKRLESWTACFDTEVEKYMLGTYAAWAEQMRISMRDEAQQAASDGDSDKRAMKLREYEFYANLMRDALEDELDVCNEHNSARESIRGDESRQWFFSIITFWQHWEHRFRSPGEAPRPMGPGT